ncbi:hypothetical protein J3B02_000658, partial [Coemansia erecta]
MQVSKIIDYRGRTIAGQDPNTVTSLSCAHSPYIPVNHIAQLLSTALLRCHQSAADLLAGSAVLGAAAARRQHR